MLLTVEYEGHNASGRWQRNHTHPRFATRMRVSTTPGVEPEVELTLV